MRLTKEQIENVLSQKTFCGTGVVGKTMFVKMTKELLEYKDIEEELGIDLITLFKALKGHIAVYFKQRDKIYKLDGWYLVYAVSTKEFLLKNIDNELNTVLLIKDYGKTWTLTNEELK